ncbi:cysteine-rich repeat secretory protein 38-like [Cajanus cajan]|uniref:cysteine-rich repeat secretory protein 38-like n=1 Tax=Cajanus cajan TaxID=3821 RepID=UPI00098D883D|nr:cysteine-rich repeat secretory protein 38-like [Cajanus cajan]
MAGVSSSQFSFVCCLLFLFLFMIISETRAQPSYFLNHFCDNDKGNFTANSTYHANLNTLLSNLTSNVEIDYGFYNSSYGQNSEKVNAIGLCRGDVKPGECRHCLNMSTALLTRLCPNQKEAISYHDKCMLRYSNRTIFGVVETWPSFYMWNANNATDVEQFNQVLGNLMRNLTSIAASGDSRRKYAAANAYASNFQTIYGAVQCTPDLSDQDCNDCLVGAISEISSCCGGKRGGRVARPSCNIRYENYRFYGEPVTADAPAPSL